MIYEVQAKTHDISEALTYQTESAKILSVIASSPTDVEPVLKAIVESACELCEAYDAVLALMRTNPQLPVVLQDKHSNVGFAKFACPLNNSLENRFVTGGASCHHAEHVCDPRP